MATVTLGNIKFNWKGAWNSGTAYVIDDVVSLSGSSYVSIQAGTNQNPASASAYWQQMSAAGSSGTDLTSTLTTQGDILIRDGSGLARLGYGTAGQVLQTGGSGANPSWVNASGGKTLAFQNYKQNTRVSLSTSAGETSLMSGSFTQAKANSDLLVQYRFPFFTDASGNSRTYFTFDGTKTFEAWSWDYNAVSSNTMTWSGHFVVSASSSTGSKNWAIGWHSNSSATKPAGIFCPSNTDDGRMAQTVAEITIQELDF
jgi:hypothetical protein